MGRHGIRWDPLNVKLLSSDFLTDPRIIDVYMVQLCFDFGSCTSGNVDGGVGTLLHYDMNAKVLQGTAIRSLRKRNSRVATH